MLSVVRRFWMVQVEEINYSILLEYRFDVNCFCFFFCFFLTLHKSFPLRNSPVNMTKSAVICGLVTFTEEIFNGELSFLCSVRCSVTYYLRWE